MRVAPSAGGGGIAVPRVINHLCSVMSDSANHDNPLVYDDSPEAVAGRLAKGLRRRRLREFYRLVGEVRHWRIRSEPAIVIEERR